MEAVTGMVSAALLERLVARAHAFRWRAAPSTLATSIEAAVARRFHGVKLAAGDVEGFVDSLHLEDLALACACRDGDEEAWDYFLREYRPVLMAAAHTIARGHAHDLVEPLFAELFGVPNAHGVRSSLLAHYHGRARLSTWLRTVLAQRHVDAYRQARRFVPLSEAGSRMASADGLQAALPEPRRGAYLDAIQQALDASIQAMEADDRLRLRLYYGESLRLAQIGRMYAESEATASRKLERARRALREAVETRLREEHRLGPAEIQACFEMVTSAPEIGVSDLLGEGRP